MGYVDGTREDGTDVKGFGIILESAIDPANKLHFSTSDVQELLEIQATISRAIGELIAAKGVQ